MPTLEKPWNERWAILLRPEYEDKVAGIMPESSRGEAEQKPRMIGLIGVVREQELGYKMNPDYWGKGYMTEALVMMSNLFWEMEGKL